MVCVYIGTYRTWPASLDFAQHTDSRADLPWGAVATLEGVVLDERALQWMQVPIFGKPLDCDDFRILMRDGEGETTVCSPTIKQDGTGTALSVVAAFLWAGKPKVFTKYVQEGGSGIDCEMV